MLKKIPVDQLRIGMYLHKLDASWINHPFWRSAFLISQQADIDKLVSSTTTHVIIDTSKGDDVAAPDAEKTATSSVPPPVASKKQVTDIADELAQAARICAQANREVKNMFQEARLG